MTNESWSKSAADSPAALRQSVDRLDNIVREIVQMQSDFQKVISAATTTMELTRLRMEYLERDVKVHAEAAKSITQEIATLKVVVERGRGGWMAIAGVGGLIAGAVALIAQIKAVFSK